MEEVVKTVLESISSVKKPQRVFIAYLFSVLMVFQGKETFKNMSRYSSMSENLFRDAKQYTGLTHCQLHKKEAMYTQVNASLSERNLLKIEDRLTK